MASSNLSTQQTNEGEKERIADWVAGWVHAGRSRHELRRLSKWNANWVSFVKRCSDKAQIALRSDGKPVPDNWRCNEIATINAEKGLVFFCLCLTVATLWSNWRRVRKKVSPIMKTAWSDYRTKQKLWQLSSSFIHVSDSSSLMHQTKIKTQNMHMFREQNSAAVKILRDATSEFVLSRY